MMLPVRGRGTERWTEESLAGPANGGMQRYPKMLADLECDSILKVEKIV